MSNILQIWTYSFSKITDSKKEIDTENIVKRRTLSWNIRVQTISQNFSFIFKIQRIINNSLKIFEDSLYENWNIMSCIYDKAGWNISWQDFLVEIIEIDDSKYKYQNIDDLNKFSDITIKLTSI